MHFPRVHWSEGMFLVPQHFQAADAHWDETVRQRGQWDLPYYYGLHRIEISQTALESKRFQLNVCEARFRDGASVSFTGVGPGVAGGTVGAAATALPAIGLDVPPDRTLGDLGTPVAFELARQLRRAPKVIAQELASRLDGLAGIRAEATGSGYLNFFLDRRAFLLERLTEPPAPAVQTGKTIVQHTAINPNKAAHVGHLRNMILGAAVCSLLEAAGYDVVRTNYPGDTGLHVIKWMWNYLRNHAGEQPPEDRIRWMGDLYAEANRMLEENPEFETEMRGLFASARAIATRCASPPDRFAGMACLRFPISR